MSKMHGKKLTPDEAKKVKDELFAPTDLLSEPTKQEKDLEDYGPETSVDS